MLVANLEVWPGGDESKKRTVGHVLIGNDGTRQQPHIGSYDVALSHSGKFYGKKGLWKSGRVDYFRRDRSPYNLLHDALADALFRQLQPSAAAAKHMIGTLQRALAKKSDPQGTLFTGEL